MNPDDVGRTFKLELDEGRAATEEDARRLVATYRLGLRLGDGFEASPSATAAALTAINCAVRAFPGGVFVLAHPERGPHPRMGPRASAVDGAGVARCAAR